MHRLIGLAICAALAATSPARADVAVHVAYLRQLVPIPPTLSNLDPVPADLGVAGAALALEDNRTTGRFLGQDWTLEVTEVPEGGDFAAAAAAALATTDLVILDAPVAQTLAAADLPAAAKALLFNATNQDAALREEECRANLLHTAVSLAMRADALMQFFVTRRWTDLALIAGPRPEDAPWTAALEASATKFGLKIRWKKTWDNGADMRRNASAEVPLFTQDMAKADVILVSDETDDFARYIPYNTWSPQPVAGSEGLTATAWSPVVEQWGAAQLQSRFADAAGRPMRPEDYTAWAALRALGEAVTRSGAADAPTLRAYLLSDAFELAGFKGRPLTFRPWNGQLRQTIALATPRALVASAPLEGFLHPVNELDTLGQDQPETRCTAF
ncbi:MAG: ABC transporter substrate-binding protein [Roseivivax sp.]|nr:ABC transporter substrate-binding protein [Roseivivax sp.]